jgi:hypothetical protein
MMHSEHKAEPTASGAGDGSLLLYVATKGTLDNGLARQRSSPQE